MVIRPVIKNSIKFLVSLGILLWIFHELDLRDFVRIIHHANPWAFTLAIVIQIASAFAAATRWSWLMHLLKFPERFPFYTKIYFICTLFNQILPTSVGGDAVRVVALRHHGKMNAFYAVFLDRIYGITGLFLLNALAVYFCFHLLPHSLASIIALISFGGLFGAVALYFLRLISFMHRITLFKFFVALSLRLHQTIKKNPFDLLAKLVLAALPNLLTIVAIFCIAKGVHMPVHFIDFLVIMPPVILLTLIPISLAGWGVRESAMIGLFAFLHIPKALSLSVSIMYGIMLSVAALPGLYFYLVKKKRALHESRHPTQN